MFEFLRRLFARNPPAPAVVERQEPKVAFAPNPGLEEALSAEPSDATAWHVYADWLIEQGVTWGAVIAAAHQGQPDTKAQEAAEAALVGGLGARVMWHRGIIRRFDFRPEKLGQEPMHLVLERVLKHPAGHFVRKLTLGLPPSDSTHWHLEALVKAMVDAGPLPCLVELDMSADAQHMDQPSWRRVGDIRGLWKAAPRLKELKLQGAGGSDGEVPCMLAPIDAPHLERFVFKSGGLDETVPLELGAATLPSLSLLELWLGRPDYGCTTSVASLTGILSGVGMPKLKTLALRNAEEERELIEAVAGSALLPRLQSIDFSMGIMSSEAAAALQQHAQRFRHLQRLDLSDNYFSASEQTALKAVLPMAEFGVQKTEDEPGFRYATVGE